MFIIERSLNLGDKLSLKFNTWTNLIVDDNQEKSWKELWREKSLDLILDELEFWGIIKTAQITRAIKSLKIQNKDIQEFIRRELIFVHGDRTLKIHWKWSYCIYKFYKEREKVLAYGRFTLFSKHPILS